ncbi:uncharacterized protein [Apostichopus japonicus]|uniref:uncharacterized protein n=1 Tax=Stichopus japonicus TaxID=307972 RepID=UPI003AB3F22D
MKLSLLRSIFYWTNSRYYQISLPKTNMTVPYFPLSIEVESSDTDESSENDGENIADQQYLPGGGDIQPYMYEPETDDSGDENDGEGRAGGGDVQGDEGNRQRNLDWCTCGHCAIMTTARECRCCTEIDQVKVVMEEEGAGCITTHPGFHAVCLDRWGLRTAYFAYRQQYGENARESSLHEKYRHVAYRQLVRFCWQFLGKDVRVILPACAVLKIRDTFPSDNYEGFRLPRL